MKKVQEFENSIVFEDEDGNVEVKPKKMKYIFEFINSDKNSKTINCIEYGKEVEIKYLGDEQYCINIDNIGFLKPYDMNEFINNLKESIQKNNADNIIESTFRKELINSIAQSFINEPINKEENGWNINRFLKLTYNNRLVWRNPYREETAYNTTLENNFEKKLVEIKINNKNVSLLPKEYSFIVKYKKLIEMDKEDILQSDEAYWSTIKNCVREIENGRLSDYSH